MSAPPSWTPPRSTSPAVITGSVAAAGADTSIGEGFDLTGGLIGVYAPDFEVTLKAELTQTGIIRLWWPAAVSGYQLEFTTVLGPDAVWQAVEPTPVGHEYLTAPIQPTRFFRLRQA